MSERQEAADVAYAVLGFEQIDKKNKMVKETEHENGCVPLSNNPG